MIRGKRLLPCLLAALLFACGLSVAHAQAPGKGKGKGKKADAAQKAEGKKPKDTKAKGGDKANPPGAPPAAGRGPHPPGPPPGAPGHPGPKGKGEGLGMGRPDRPGPGAHGPGPHPHGPGVGPAPDGGVRPGDRSEARERHMKRVKERREALAKKPEHKKRVQGARAKKGPFVAEQRKHLKRMAAIRRLQAVAGEKGDAKLAERARSLLEKETARHEKFMKKHADKKKEKEQ